MPTKSFLPAIQEFSRYLENYNQQKMVLAEKMYALQKKEQTNQFISSFGKRLQSTEDIKDLSLVTSTAVSEAMEKGLDGALPIIQTLAQVHQSYIGEVKLNKQTADYENFFLSQYGNQDFSWEGEKVKGKEVIEQMRSTIKDPVTRFNALQNLKDSAIVKQRGVTINRGTPYLHTADVDKQGNIYSGESLEIYANKEGIYYDSNKSRGFDKEDKALPPDELKAYTDIVESNDRFNKQMATYNKPVFANMVDPEGRPLFYDPRGLYYNEVTDGKPTGKKHYIENIGQFSKITTPSKTEGKISSADFQIPRERLNYFKVNAVTALVDAGYLDRGEQENSIKSVTDGKPVSMVDVPDEVIEQMYNKIIDKIKNQKKLNDEENNALVSLSAFRNNREEYREWADKFIDQKFNAPTGVPFKDASTPVKPISILNADQYKLKQRNK